MDGFIYSPLGKGHLSKPPGLRNEGNICYITAVLQCILSVAPLRDCLAQAIWSTGGDQPVLQALETLVVALLVTCKETSYSCESFLATLKTHWQRYRPFEQEDCRVFLQYILDALHEETLYDFRIPTFMVGATVKMMVIQAWASRERSPVSVFFGSLPVRHNVCMNPTCGHSWTVCEPVSFYVTLSLPSGNKCTLQDCLQMWASEEILPDAECPKCPLKGRKSRMMMGRLPPLLIIQLARFTFDERGGRVDRTLVEYGHSLDMKDYTVHGLQSSTSYTLVAVTCHSGGLSSGHYTSFCNRDNRWFHFDDSRVNTTTERRVISSGAYFLWYKINVEKAGDLPLDGDMALVPTADPQNDKGIESPPSQADSQDTYIMSDQAYQVESTGSSDFDEPELRKKGKASPPAHRLGKRKPVKTSHQAGGNVDASKILPQATKKGKKISFHLDTDGICNHTQIDLDVRDPLLEKCDVNGGELNLEALKSHAVVQLERLLKIYGLPSKGNKPELIERLQHHVRRGKGDKLDPGFEGGLWHKRKRARLMEEQNIQSNLPIVPFAGKPWNPFPSVHIPEGFHYLNIIEYFEDIPEMDYSYQKGVVQGDASAPVVPPLHEDTSDDDIDDIEQKGPEMTFADLCRRAIKKCISKGEQFLYSNRLLCMFDLKRDNHYFLKAQVQASMEDKVYGVVIILNVSDGSICTAECSCKAKALKRCGHIAAVFLRLWQHVFTKGFE
ncbi:Ubiquitin carboxyl-terminal hydrolase 21, partial [Frankliniella fusca]